MNKINLPASIFPDIAIVNNVTYVAVPLVTGGLGVYTSSDNYASLIRVFPSGSWPRFFNHSSGLLIAYKLGVGDDQPNTLAVANVTTGELTRTGIQAYWNSPLCWRYDGLLCVQATEDEQVWAGVWPELPKAPPIRTGVGTGLAQWYDAGDGLKLYTWNELGIGLQPVYLLDVLPNINVRQANQGGVEVALGSARGVLDPGQFTNNPRPAVASDGSLSFVYWTQDGHGATSTVLYTGVTAADLHLVAYPVTALTKPTLFGVFDKIQWPEYANAIINENADPNKLISTSGIWNVFYFEQQTGSKTSPCCYVGSPESIIGGGITNNSSDILSPWIYPEPGETPDQFQTKARTTIQRVQQTYPGMLVAPIWRVDTRIGSDGKPTLFEDQVLHCLSIASTFGLPALFFQGDRLGYVQAATELLNRWRNGQPCQVPIQPPSVQIPGVNIISYGDELTPNNNWTSVITDRNNPGYSYVIEFIKGDFHFTIKNPTGSNRSGQQRKVNIHS